MNFCYIKFIYALRVSINDFITYPLGVVYIRMFIYKCLNVCPCECTAVEGSGKVVLQLTVLSRSATAVYSNFLWRCLCLPLDVSVGVGAFVKGLSQISSFFLNI